MGVNIKYNVVFHDCGSIDDVLLIEYDEQLNLVGVEWLIRVLDGRKIEGFA
jgi:uncharacterized protein YuzE